MTKERGESSFPQTFGERDSRREVAASRSN